MARNSIVVECGPTPNGLVRHDIVAWMRESVTRILDCLDCINRNQAVQLPPVGSWGTHWAKGSLEGGLPASVIVNRMVVPKEAQEGRKEAAGMGKIAVPCDDTGRPTAMFAPNLQDNDFKPL